MATWHKVSGEGDPEPGKVKLVAIDGERIALCNSGSGYYAVADVCSHDEGPLDQGELDGCEIECPRHGARFDVRTGKALCLPAIESIQSYPVKIEDSEIWIEA